jgi:hypothetical protein
MRPRTLLLVGLSLLLPSPAAPQVRLTLQEAFLPDPQIMAVRAGGSVEVDEGDCDYGYIAETAAVGIEYETDGTSDLYFYAESDGDIMLHIETPSGDVVCDDDSHGSLNPRVELRGADDGLYLVFVGSYSEGDYQDGTLYITELDPDRSSGSSSDSGVPNLSLDPRYGDVTLSEKFGTHSVSLTAGGSIDVDVGSCGYGYVADAPDVDLRFTTSGGSTLYVYARASEDTTLLINLPNGDWICDDDGLGDSNPVLVLPRAADGLYNIWVGSYGASTTPATLYISEQDPR